MAGLVLKPLQCGTSLRQIALLPIDADALELNLTGGVARFFRAIKGLERLIELLPIGKSATQVEAGEGSFGLAKVLYGFTKVPEEEEGYAELEVPAFGLRACRLL